MNRRRKLLLALGLGTLWAAAPAVAQQQPKVARIGIIDNTAMWDAFRKGLRELGYVEGKNIAFEYRDAEGVPERLAKAATELARLPVDVIAVFGTPPARAAKEATATLPIVAISIGDPVRAGLVASLARPGGNVTGNTILGPDIGPKRLQLTKEVIPSVSRVAFLWNPDNASNTALLEDLRAAAPKLGMKVISVPLRNAVGFDGALAAMMKERPQAALMTNDPLHQRNIARIIDFLAKNRLPGMFQTRENVAAGGFMSYGASLPELFRSGALYVHKILQGTRPADLPVEQPRIFELVINLKTAKALGITVPRAVLLRADEVIQ
jgi:putative ABC transport system substrate-binding protein